ncbi:hypothetical protein NLX86_15795 [Streptomyces sp. A3M-1-3]|uniref:hypothetical protein n=1 Tax=Streptomyces sp. A3M-1-3 TaxID=2962044 RepID=UPI0020B885EF|nr:hypothetical protein [Streptomyces sp. A3M-1-3]MCP3819515.1 hypothetical protein [Streptomyces sp. A3M-1-3]
MRSALLTLRAAGAAAVLVAVPAGSAYAGEENRGTLTVTPSTVEPGGEIEFRVTGCKSRTGSATSPVFVADGYLAARDGQGSVLYGEAMIRSNAQAGWHTIRVVCDGKDGQATAGVQVVKHVDPTHKPSHEPSHKPTHRPTDEPTHKQPYQPYRPTHEPPTHEPPADEPTHHSSPVSPVRAGGGGTAAHAAEDEGPSTRHTVIGVLLAAAATVAVAGRALRRRRRSD